MSCQDLLLAHKPDGQRSICEKCGLSLWRAYCGEIIEGVSLHGLRSPVGRLEVDRGVAQAAGRRFETADAWIAALRYDAPPVTRNGSDYYEGQACRRAGPVMPGFRQALRWAEAHRGTARQRRALDNASRA